jgi:hypothetical protein
MSAELWEPVRGKKVKTEISLAAPKRFPGLCLDRAMELWVLRLRFGRPVCSEVRALCAASALLLFDWVY